MYKKPNVAALGSFRQLTQAGCTGGTDAFSVPGIGTSIGTGAVVGVDTVCLAPDVSR